VLDKDNKVQLHVLQATATYGQYWVVESGLNPGDRVIVQGTEKVRPGATAKGVPAQLPPGPASDAAAAGAPGSPAAGGAQPASGAAAASAASGA